MCTCIFQVTVVVWRLEFVETTFFLSSLVHYIYFKFIDGLLIGTICVQNFKKLHLSPLKII